jgi:ABC-2 type transport system permease protein
MNLHAISAIYRFEMARWFRTIIGSLMSPVISTSLYFIVFGAAIGSRMAQIGEVPYGAFIVPGLIMLTVLTESVSNASFGIHMPKWAGTIYELLSAPVSAFEAVIILATSRLFVSYEIAHPFLMLVFLILTAFAFCLFGFILGIWADGWEKLNMVPSLILTPMTFLGGTFYSITMLPDFWQKVSLFNPIVYVISGFRWCFFGVADVGIETSFAILLTLCTICLLGIAWIFKTGWKLKA